ncbi:MAG: sigma 54-interacting transcriptional regulator [Humidesulfovibrio sp.]|uniref:sigma 54-interacting transcriptional regulator n=1 Tax=Humidesulfovibrio sp. TaxID=2910988 RepID=UPI002733F3D1|nr:sigma 54-interacting transcriptional regulator [Humidesulfovibrio sp.]MDP2848706.1 sigma 54-interacting transcriptional regulator [Humidesulfovibrio sp.]
MLVFLRAYRAKVEMAASNQFFATWSVRRKLLTSLIPAILFVLVVAGYVTNWFSTRYLTQALQRTAQVQNLAQARELEQTLDYFRLSLTSLSGKRLDREQLEVAFEQWGIHHPGAAKELSFVGVNAEDTVILVQTASGVSEIRHDHYNFIKVSPVTQALKLRGLKPGQVAFSELTEVVYPPSAFPRQAGAQGFVLYRLTAPVHDALGTLRGYLVLGLDAHVLRNILSLYNSQKSPLYAFARTSEMRFSYYFDDHGWILFQSENLEEPERELSAEMARLGMTGDYGMPGYEKAFRPLPKHESYWRMVVDIQAGHSGVDDIELPQDGAGFLSSSHFLVYAPVFFLSNPEKGPEVIGGIAYVDRSRLTDVAEFRHMDVMMVITLSGMGLVALVVVFISRAITRPLHQLTAEIRTMFETKSLRPIRLDKRDLESDLLTRALNKMILSIQDKQEQIRRRDEQIHQVQQREKISFDSEVPASVGWRLVGEIPDLIGQSQPIVTLQSMIRKAASTEADVLVVGETGTGKELTAEGIHKFSSRANKPFISINCGGLDENLLMDTLFGHVKGAFTEARTDRKGAFLASDGGTLFLDEIGTATDKVQKALLRALSVRRIRPLGSDKEVEFNVRVIAATNVDLMELVQRGEFRDDLYYRLKVISIQTPSLRQRKEDIPILSNHFLRELAGATGKPELGLSRGALEKLMNHDWPGNVRELKNCITRASAFAESAVLYAEDLMFDDATVSPSLLFGDGTVGALSQAPSRLAPPPEQSYRREPAASEQEDAAPPQRPPMPEAEPLRELTGNQRVQTALRLARERGSFSRVDYQNAVGAGISQRTAQYDLQALVKRGVLRKTGKGPSTLYLLT